MLISTPGANLVEVSQVVGCSAPQLELAAAQIIAALLVDFPTGGVVGLQLSAGAAGGVACLTIVGTRAANGALAPYASAVVRCAAASDAGVLDLVLERIRTEQSPTAAASLHTSSAAVGGAGAVFLVAQLWGPASPPSPVVEPDGIDTLLYPEASGPTGSTFLASVNFVGGTYATSRPLEFNRFVFRILAVAIAGGTIAGAIYQAPNGLSGSPMDLVASWSQAGIVAPNTVHQIPLTPPTVQLVAGIYAVVWGRVLGDGGSFELATYQMAGSGSLMSNNIPAGVHATAFNTAIPASLSPPATLDVAAQTGTPTNVQGTVRVRRV